MAKRRRQATSPGARREPGADVLKGVPKPIERGTREDLAALHAQLVEISIDVPREVRLRMVEEYEVKCFDVWCRWFLTMFQNEAGLDRYLAFVDRMPDLFLPIHETNPFVQPQRLRARIAGRVSHWRSEALAKLRKLGISATQESLGQSKAQNTVEADRESTRDIINRFLKAKKMTNERPAKKARVDEAVIYALKRGECRCGTDALERIAKALGCEPSHLHSKSESS